MGIIREPNGIDLIIAPASYTDADRMEVSAFLRKHKESKSGKIVEPSRVGNKTQGFCVNYRKQTF
jgi:hypothetical protein